MADIIRERLAFDPRDPSFQMRLSQGHTDDDDDAHDYAKQLNALVIETYGKQKKRKPTDETSRKETKWDEVETRRKNFSPFSQYHLYIPISDAYWFKLDVVVASHLPVNNYTVNLCTLQFDLVHCKWKTQSHLPYSSGQKRTYDKFASEGKMILVQHCETDQVLWQYFSKTTWRLPELSNHILNNSQAEYPALPLSYVELAQKKDNFMSKRGWSLINMGS